MKSSAQSDPDRLSWAELSTLMQFARGYAARAIWALVFLVLAKLATVAVPILMKSLIDQLDAENTQTSWLLAPVGLVAAYGLLRAASSVFNELKSTIFIRVRMQAMLSLSLAVLDKMHALSLRWHLERRTGGISKDLDRANTSLSNLLNYMVFTILPTLVELGLVFAVLLFSFDLSYSVVALGSIIVYIIFTFSISNWRIGHRHEMNRYESEANGRAVDSLINFETVKYFNNEQTEVDAYRERLSSWTQAAERTYVSMSILNGGQALIVTASVTLMLWLATSGVMNGELTLGELVMINAMMLQLFIPLNFLGTTYRMLKYAVTDMRRVITLLDTTPEVQDVDNAPELAVSKGEIRFENVEFAYNEERQILKGLSFEIGAGQKVAIVGPSGSGKSTLAKLLYRFYDLQSGQICIDGQDISKVTQASLRKVISVVPQDTVLFNDTLRYNLIYANAEADDDAIAAALDAADLSRFVAQLDEGLETVVGERGLKLSGGEKQRVAIARAILKNAPIVVFDEATSSLDTASERSITSAINRVSKDVTSVVIAHRLSTVVDADKIIVLKQGEIVEQGTHQSLLQSEGVYHQLWQLQVDEPAD